MNGPNQVEPIFVHESVARDAAKGYLFYPRHGFELRKLREKFSSVESLPRLDVPGKIEAVFPHRVDGPSGDNYCDPRKLACPLSVLSTIFSAEWMRVFCFTFSL